jgi:SAM-dependent methyltransferase
MSSFEEEYFDYAYGGDYERRNPKRKLQYYLKQILDVMSSGKLLDVGCAYGLFLSMAQQYYDVSGCDISRYAVTRVAERLPGIKVYHADIESMELGGTYDIITCFDILEHVKDLDKAFNKINLLLNQEGILGLTVPVYDNIIGKLVDKLDKDETHIWKESREFWRRKLWNHSFHIVKDLGLWRYPLGRHYIFFGSKILRNFSPALFLLGRKHDTHSSARVQ